MTRQLIIYRIPINPRDISSLYKPNTTRETIFSLAKQRIFIVIQPVSNTSELRKKETSERRQNGKRKSNTSNKVS